jgi:hypothetical protein
MSAIVLQPVAELARNFFLGAGNDAVTLFDNGKPTGVAYVALQLGDNRVFHLLDCSEPDIDQKIAALAAWPAVQQFVAHVKQEFDTWGRAVRHEGRA